MKREIGSKKTTIMFNARDFRDNNCEMTFTVLLFYITNDIIKSQVDIVCDKHNLTSPHNIRLPYFAEL